MMKISQYQSNSIIEEIFFGQLGIFGSIRIPAPYAGLSAFWIEALFI